jgi:hypothetical protein
MHLEQEYTTSEVISFVTKWEIERQGKQQRLHFSDFQLQLPQASYELHLNDMSSSKVLYGKVDATSH